MFLLLLSLPFILCTTTEPPHCSKTIFGTAMSSKKENSLSSEGLHRQFSIGLHTTVCYRLTDKDRAGTNSIKEEQAQAKDPLTWLHTIRLEKIEHQHQISEFYEFAIPEVSTDCICTCRASESCSAKTHQFKQCPRTLNQDERTSCYRTFFPNQDLTGCASDASPSLCCEVKFKPYGNDTYTAVKLDNPTTFATFIYTAYDYTNGAWVEMEKKTIETELDGHTQDEILDSHGLVTMSVDANGRTSRQLEAGMYFAKNLPGGEMSELRRYPLNEPGEMNFNILGWFRRHINGTFQVNNGEFNINKLHTATVTNCKEQKYNSTLNAKFYMSIQNKIEHFNLSMIEKPLKSMLLWIQSARIHNKKEAIVTHAKENNLFITLQVNDTAWLDGKRIDLFHNSSKIEDFSGTIVVDSRNNRYLNLTLYGASGKIHGEVKSANITDLANIYTFTTYIPHFYTSDHSQIISLPFSVEAGPRIICLRAKEQRDQTRICRLITYHESPLENTIFEKLWREEIGSCSDCNQDSETLWNTFANFFTPNDWVNGIQSLKIADIGHYAQIAYCLAILTIICIIIKYIILPLVRCFTCPLKLFSFLTRRRKNKRRIRLEIEKCVEVRV